MIYQCKKCGKEILLSGIDLQAAAFCECGGAELIFLRTNINHKPKKKDILALIMEGVQDHYRAA